MSKLPIGVQLYTLREETEKDFVGTLKKVKEIGYDGVEFAGFGGYSAVEMKEILENIGLKGFSSHVPLTQLENNLTEVIEYHKTIGAEVIACPFIPQEMWNSKEAYLKLAELFNKVGEQCKEAGIQFCYHHHAFEFVQFDGEYGLDLIFSNTKPELVQLECDVYWVQHAGLSPAEYINKYDGRCPLVHVKDMKDNEGKDFAPVGTGIIDIASVVKTAEEVGARWLVVEQDKCEGPAIESVELSYNNLVAITK